MRSIAVEHRGGEAPDLIGATGPDRRGDHLRQLLRLQDPGAHGVLEVVAHVGDAIRPGDDLTLGRGRRRAPPRVVADAVERLGAQVQLGERHVGAVHSVVVTGGGQVRRERLLRRVPAGTVTAVVRERDRLGERHAEPGDAGNADRDLGDLDRVR